jgi:hypothetical protein
VKFGILRPKPKLWVKWSGLFWSNLIPTSPEAQIKQLAIIHKPDPLEFSNSAIPRSLNILFLWKYACFKTKSTRWYDIRLIFIELVHELTVINWWQLVPQKLMIKIMDTVWLFYNTKLRIYVFMSVASSYKIKPRVWCSLLLDFHKSLEYCCRIMFRSLNSRLFAKCCVLPCKESAAKFLLFIFILAHQLEGLRVERGLNKSVQLAAT